MVEVIVVLNNYFHDVATALLASCALLMIAVYRVMQLPDQRDRYASIYEKLYRFFTKVAVVTLIWILVGGVPRLIYFKRIEWTIYLDNKVIPALIVKHIAMFLLVIAGLVFWQKVRKDVAALRSTPGDDRAQGQAPVA
ncbi:hypothetical protein ACFLQU_04060 [Verrucomicrobiota bacterium]